jgi:predicted transcriptional regulator
MELELINAVSRSSALAVILLVLCSVFFSMNVYFIKKTLAKFEEKFDKIECKVIELLSDIRVMTNNMDATNQAMTNVHVRLESQATDLKDQQTQLNRHDVRIEILENIIEK